MMLYLHRRHDGTILVHTGGEPLGPKHIRQAETVAQSLSAIREAEAIYSGNEIQVLDPYENEYWRFAEQGRYKLAMMGRKPRASVARTPLYHYVVICMETHAGRIRRHAYRTHRKVTRDEAVTAGHRKHPHAKVTVITLKRDHSVA